MIRFVMSKEMEGGVSRLFEGPGSAFTWWNWENPRETSVRRLAEFNSNRLASTTAVLDLGILFMFSWR
jgi:hypothetical protein